MKDFQFLGRHLSDSEQKQILGGNLVPPGDNGDCNVSCIIVCGTTSNDPTYAIANSKSCNTDQKYYIDCQGARQDPCLK